jgi:hypothetical protein
VFQTEWEGTKLYATTINYMATFLAVSLDAEKSITPSHPRPIRRYIWVLTGYYPKHAVLSFLKMDDLTVRNTD